MATPRPVSRSEPDPHQALPWNAMIDLCAMEPLENCSPVQRRAALLFWYQSEVNNGGHFQYFMNKPNFPHEEVLALLAELGASHAAAVFAAVLQHMKGQFPEFAESPEDYLSQEKEADLLSFDVEWGSKGDQEIQACLLSLLRANEGEFVAWQP
jgi:hypothetical protein